MRNHKWSENLERYLNFTITFQLQEVKIKNMIAHCGIGYSKRECSYGAEVNTNWCELSGQQFNKLHQKP